MAGAGENVFQIPAGVPFARELARGIISRVGRDPLALADVLIFVPTRRAARNLREAFVQEQTGAALGPNIHAFGDIDEDELLIDFAESKADLPPAIAPLRRCLLLARLVQRWHKARGERISLVQAADHAGELAHFLDEAQTQEIEFNQLDKLVTGSLAGHWQDIVRFLNIISAEWPKVLAAESASDPAERRNKLLDRISAGLKSRTGKGLVIVAGSTGSVPATARLLKSITELPNGLVVLPALDTELDDAAWETVRDEPSHPQHGLCQLLVRLEVKRREVQAWADYEPQKRLRFLAEALRPPPTTDAWRGLADKEKENFAHALDGLSLIEAATVREEALAIACAMREALEAPGRTAALVTPDREIARRVENELGRWEIAIDDSAGQPLTRTPPGAFLALLARAAADAFSPVSLLGLLKHPLCACGTERVAFVRTTRALERVLRGLPPEDGLRGIQKALDKRNASVLLIKWFSELARVLAPFEKASAARNATLGDLVLLHGRTAEALADTGSGDGPNNLWRGEAGEVAARLMAELWEHGRGIPIETAAEYADIFRSNAALCPVRPRFGQHPRIAILGPLEARLLHFDLVILAGLNEGTWPANATTDPWLSRPLRAQLGLEPPERRIGLAAHDFYSLTAGARVLLTRSLKRDGAPTVPSRFVLRVRQLAQGLGLHDRLRRADHYLQWARALDEAPRVKPDKRPAPTPPLAARPRKLRVTEIETWLRDPYAIYARHVLKLDPLDPLEMEPDARLRGTVIHKALEKFLIECPKELPQNAVARLIAIASEVFAERGASEALLALWLPRFERAARKFVEYERGRRLIISHSAVEQKGAIAINDAPGGPFMVTGRADRIDFFSDGSASILDYKTGAPPGQGEVLTFLNPQLPLEAAMLLRGGFAELRAKSLRELIYVSLTGTEPPLKIRPVNIEPDAAAAAVYEWLKRRIAEYDDAKMPYPSRLKPKYTHIAGDYDHLARVREWSVYGEPGATDKSGGE
ncbi:MAG: double-strand break repair protein AddB [Alphaproteobacteria bacterium]